ncbi:MAG: hypothetical protein V7L11_17680, partial [Nostoc sp.]|uniref:hypothetical protein n=1 Tax=Nostoc sp. TaxID=1180 RepID=UPI002FF4C43C
MTVGSTENPSTVSIPAPIYKLGQEVNWEKEWDGEAIPGRLFTGNITELVYRIDCEASSWEYTMAITSAYQGEHFLD